MCSPLHALKNTVKKQSLSLLFLLYFLFSVTHLVQTGKAAYASFERGGRLWLAFASVPSIERWKNRIFLCLLIDAVLSIPFNEANAVRFSIRSLWRDWIGERGAQGGDAEPCLDQANRGRKTPLLPARVGESFQALGGCH